MTNGKLTVRELLKNNLNVVNFPIVDINIFHNELREYLKKYNIGDVQVSFAENIVYITYRNREYVVAVSKREDGLIVYGKERPENYYYVEVYECKTGLCFYNIENFLCKILTIERDNEYKPIFRLVLTKE